MFLGKHEINNKHEPGSVRCYTQNIITHPDYHEDNLELGDADLAIIIIREIQFSAYVSMIFCKKCETQNCSFIFALDSTNLFIL